jgi:hypothetical protein
MRCVITNFANRSRYIVFMQTIVVGTIAEFRGELIDITAGDNVLSYNLDIVLDELIGGTNVQYVKANLECGEESAANKSL